LRRLAEIGWAQALPVHVRHQHDVTIAGNELAARNRVLGHAHPVRRHRHRRTLAGDLFAIDQRPLGGERVISSAFLRRPPVITEPDRIHAAAASRRASHHEAPVKRGGGGYALRDDGGKGCIPPETL
jgi:hypothetical protein